MAIATDVQAINERVSSEAAFVDRLLSEVSKVIVGQQVMVDRLLIGLLCGGHVLLEGVQGHPKPRRSAPRPDLPTTSPIKSIFIFWLA